MTLTFFTPHGLSIVGSNWPKKDSIKCICLHLELIPDLYAIASMQGETLLEANGGCIAFGPINKHVVGKWMLNNDTSH